MNPMFSALVRRFPVTDRLPVEPAPSDLPPALLAVFDEFGGATLDNGFYRFHVASSARRSDQACANLIGGFAGRFRCFAVDWLGREIAADARPGRPNKVIIVDPGGGEYLTTPCVIEDWHDAVAEPDGDPLAVTFYQDWKKANPEFRGLRFDQAIGYRVPLFLGGEDEVTNLEVTDRETYFEICTQLAQGVRDMPPGTTIESIRLQGR
jgi:hypothetical protein